MSQTTKKPKTTSVQCRVNLEVKQEAETILNNLGVTISDLFNMTLYQVRSHHGIPFEVREPYSTPDEIIWEHIQKSRAERATGVSGYTSEEAREILLNRIEEVANSGV